MAIELESVAAQDRVEIAASAARSRLLALWMLPAAIGLCWGGGAVLLRSWQEVAVAVSGDGAKVLWRAAPFLARLRARGVHEAGRVADAAVWADLAGQRDDRAPCDAAGVLRLYQRSCAALTHRPAARDLALALCALEQRLRLDLAPACVVACPDQDVRVVAVATDDPALAAEPPHLVRAAAFSFGLAWLEREGSRQGEAASRDEWAARLAATHARHPALREWARRPRVAPETRHGRVVALSGGRRPLLRLVRAEAGDSVRLAALRAARRLADEDLGSVVRVDRSGIALHCPTGRHHDAERIVRACLDEEARS